jgi:hypothetical protein
MATRPIIELDLSELTDYLKALGDPSLAREAVKTGMRAGGEDLRGKMTQNLSGRILNIQTGHYRRNIYVSQPKDEGDAIVLEYGARGVPYAAAHEFGITIKHPGGTPFFIRPDGLAQFVSKRIGRSLGLPETRPHDIPIPERRPLRDAAERAVPSFKQQIALYTIKALKDAGK